jgi:hypothetical protein
MVCPPRDGRTSSAFMVDFTRQEVGVQRDQAAIAALKQMLTGIALSLGALPSPRLENLDEWKTKVPQSAQTIALALHEREPTIAHVLDGVASECELMIAAIERDRGDPPKGERITNREKRISEHHGRVIQVAQNLG